MTIKYSKFELPNKINFDKDSATQTYARFVAEPFERGYGHTVGNSIRRMLLTSIEAPAIVSVAIEGVPHEYMAVEGIVEDMTNIVLNFKQVLLRRLSAEDSDVYNVRNITTVLEISQEDLDARKGAYKITVADLIKDDIYKVINPELCLFTVTAPMTRRVNIKVANGHGYIPSERHEIEDKKIGEIVLDSAFSPVRLVNYYVENTRIGQDTDYDKLILEVSTDGRVTPYEAVSFAAQIGIMHLAVLTKVEEQQLTFSEDKEEKTSADDEMMKKLALRIGEIELSVRSTNCLRGAKIETIGELVTKSENDMLKYRNFGKKSLNEIKAKLTDMSLSLGMDLSRYGITSENVRDRIQEHLDEQLTNNDKNSNFFGV